MKPLFCSPALSAVLSAQGPAKTSTGVITDTMCGKEHKHMGVADEAKCVRDCAKSGRNQYALVAGGAMYILSDQQSSEKFAAQRVRVKGALYEKTGILKVESIEAARQAASHYFARVAVNSPFEPSGVLYMPLPESPSMVIVTSKAPSPVGTLNVRTDPASFTSVIGAPSPSGL